MRPTTPCSGVERVTEITDDWHAIVKLRTQIDRPEHAFLVALVGDEAVATGSASRQGDLVVVQRLYVKPAHQKAGHGVALLEALIAKLGPAAAVELEVAVTNAYAIRFYEARGFAVAARRGDDVVMRRAGG